LNTFNLFTVYPCYVINRNIIFGTKVQIISIICKIFAKFVLEYITTLNFEVLKIAGANIKAKEEVPLTNGRKFGVTN
jgi:hypothetical protein